jgi:hypothetical protein
MGGGVKAMREGMKAGEGKESVEPRLLRRGGVRNLAEATL